MTIDVDGIAIVFKRLTTDEIPYLGYYDRHEEQIYGEDILKTKSYLARGKISRSGNILSVFSIKLL
jgi:hypothetical protein